MAKKSVLAEKLDEVRERIGKACAKSGRDPKGVTMIAVTKTAAPEQIREILQLGVGDLGESRAVAMTQRAGQINEFYQRASTLEGMPPRLRWHMIGHMQRNKIKMVLPICDMVHSVDSLRLAEELDLASQRMNKRTSVLLQVNVSGEEQKFGVAVGASIHLAEQIDTMPNLQMAGIMAMAPLNSTEADCRRIFCRAREIFEEMKWNKIGGNGLKHLSMGMSSDFEPAIMEGATLVRVGTLLFGEKAVDEDGEME